MTPSERDKHLFLYTNNHLFFLLLHILLVHTRDFYKLNYVTSKYKFFLKKIKSGQRESEYILLL